jgi:hypothetical protein
VAGRDHPIELLNKDIKSRPDVVRIFPDQASIARLTRNPRERGTNSATLPARVLEVDMAGEANGDEFVGAKSDRNYAFAMGWNGKSDRGESAMRGGIAHPQELKLHPGQVLYRIGHSNLWDVFNQSSPWWIMDQTFLELSITSETAGTPLVHLIRMKLALTPDFGTCNRIFAAIVRRPLRALVGKGFPVWEDPDPDVRAKLDRPLAWPGSVEIPQLFIPGLRDRSKNPPGLSAVATEALVFAKPQHVSEWVRFRTTHFPPM